MKRKNSLISITLATLLLVSLCAVFASTSVSAADSGSSGVSVRAPTGLVGYPIPAGTGPSLCTMKGSYAYMYIFVKGHDGALWWNREDLSALGSSNWGWSGWASLGKPTTGSLTSSPAAVSRQAGLIDVYVRGTDGFVWMKQYYNGAWHNWLNVGGKTVAPGTGPGASGWSGHEDIFIKSTDGAIYTITYTQAGWSRWASLGKPTTGSLTSSPASVSRAAGLVGLYARGADGFVWGKSYYNGAWHNWFRILGAQVASGTGPAVCAWRYTQGYSQPPYIRLVDREDLLITGTDGAMYWKTYTTASGWTTTWANLGGHLTSSPTATTLQYSIEVFARWSNGLLYSKEYFNKQWSGWMGGGQGP